MNLRWPLSIVTLLVRGMAPVFRTRRERALRDPWPEALGAGMAAVFACTFPAHFARPARDGLVAIVPAWVPWPRAVVAVTGILEALVAIGLALPRTRRASAVLAGAMLLAMFPANVRAAAGVDHEAAPCTPLVRRTALQAVFLAAAAVAARPGGR